MAKAEDKAADKNTRSDVGSDANPAVDATRVHVAQSDNRNGEGINADNATELLTENEIAKRNRAVGDLGTRHEDEDLAKDFNL